MGSSDIIWHLTMLNLVGGPSSSLQYNNEQVAKDGWFDLLDYSLESFKLALAFKKLGVSVELFNEH